MAAFTLNNSCFTRPNLSAITFDQAQHLRAPLEASYLAGIAGAGGTLAGDGLGVAAGPFFFFARRAA